MSKTDTDEVRMWKARDGSVWPSNTEAFFRNEMLDLRDFFNEYPIYGTQMGCKITGEDFLRYFAEPEVHDRLFIKIIKPKEESNGA